MNSVILMGRLTADPELKSTNNGISYARFTVAVDRPTKAGEEKKADFIRCTAWRNTAEFISKWFTKGKMIAVEGAIQTGEYTDQDGKKVFTTDINVSKAHFCGDKREEGQATRAQNAPALPTAEAFQQVPLDSDLPF